ncbi:hypothetical protein C8J56DRAFT_588929 [Mycena floridula]|nr:hypothetical protein C8J56DRAFT_588929 [Mycena floridula]
MLPEELPVVLIQFVAQNSAIFDDRYQNRSSPLSFQCSNIFPDIRSLPLVNRQFRRLCSRFLLSYIKCDELLRFRDACHANLDFANCIRTLDIDCTPIEVTMLAQILPSLTALVQSDLHYTKIETQLLAAINAHPILDSVASGIESFEDFPGDGSLSRIIIKSTTMRKVDTLVEENRSLSTATGSRGCEVHRLFTASDIPGMETAMFHWLHDLRIFLEGLPAPWLCEKTPRSRQHHVQGAIRHMLPRRDEISSTVLLYVAPFLDEAEHRSFAFGGLGNLRIARTDIPGRSLHWTSRFSHH